MKNLFVKRYSLPALLLFLVLSGSSCAPRTLDGFYQKYRCEGESERIALSMAWIRPLTGLVPKEDRGEVRSVLGKMKSMKVMTLNLEEKSLPKARSEMSGIMQERSFEELMTVSTGEELVKIMLRKGRKDRKEVILVAMSGTEVSIVDFKLRLSDADIESLLSETMDMHNNSKKKNNPGE